MLSTIKIDIDSHRREHVSIKSTPSDDPRDKLVGLFLQTATPSPITLDGYARVTKLEQTADGGWLAEIVPIHPVDMVDHIELIKENAAKFDQIPTDRQLGK